MIQILALFILICSTQSLRPNEQCAFGSYPPQEKRNISTYTIHLDLPPAKRWEELGKNEAKIIKEILDQLKYTLLNVTSYAKYLIDFVDDHLKNVPDTFPYPYGDEIKGIANATGLPLGEIVAYNIFYEIFTLCTSILVHDEKGTLYHARNLDFGIFLGWDEKLDTWAMTEILRKSIVNLEWQDQGKVVFRSVGFAGYIGVITGMKPGVLSLTINERFNIDGGYLGLLKWFLGYRSSNWLSFLTRQVMESAQSYDQAKKWLVSKELLAPVYFILGGNKSEEACIITRSRRKSLDVWNIGTRNSTFYLAETNYDHWERPPFYDDRRTTAVKCLESLSSQDVEFDTLFDVLSTKPVLNKLTTYTTLMQVSSGRMETYLRECRDPCPPW